MGERESFRGTGRKERIMDKFIYVHTEKGARYINLRYVKEIICSPNGCVIYFAGQEKDGVKTLEGEEAMWRLMKIAEQNAR